jgi:GNAT superfamily N-acetyltransferase
MQEFIEKKQNKLMTISVPVPNKRPGSFRLLTRAESAAAYNIVKQAVNRLLIRHLPAWLVPYQTYAQRQANGENYGVFLDQQLGAVVTLSASYHPQDWAEYVPETDVIWLGTLCVADQFRGQGLGRDTLMQAEAFLRAQGRQAVWLDCYYGNGFLPAYYQAFGYTWIARKALIFEDGSLHDSVLMSKNL